MKRHALELMRYGVNGLVATAVHYLVLFIGIELIQFSSVGLTNLMASTVGITASFIGNRYFVFQCTGETIATQLTKFAGLYVAIAIIHGFVLFIWSDHYGLNYNYGFVIAVIIQFSLGYLGLKMLIFKPARAGLQADDVSG
jgi:putative flippase GtrA